MASCWVGKGVCKRRCSSYLRVNHDSVGNNGRLGCSATGVFPPAAVTGVATYSSTATNPIVIVVVDAGADVPFSTRICKYSFVVGAGMFAIPDARCVYGLLVDDAAKASTNVAIESSQNNCATCPDDAVVLMVAVVAPVAQPSRAASYLALVAVCTIVQYLVEVPAKQRQRARATGRPSCYREGNVIARHRGDSVPPGMPAAPVITPRFIDWPTFWEVNGLFGMVTVTDVAEFIT